MRLQEHVQHTQRLESIGAVSAGIAHEFKNILAPILGNAELASLDIPAGHPAHRWINQIIKSTQSARDLVQQILTFGRQAPVSQSALSIGDVVTDAARMLRVALPRSVEIVRSIAPGLPPVSLDANQIQQVLMNLGINAWQAMDKDCGEISIAVDLVTIETGEDPELSPGRYVRLQVSDNGKGMDQETLHRIFEPFFTTKAIGEGTGLGLSMVHGIVKSHRGAIQVTSSPGEGTTFEIFFPPAITAQNNL
jgi:signal transduction histidine kinase